jgi:hypothetical protein
MAKWIQKAIKRPGAFKAKAKRAGMSTSAYASKVLTKGSKASTRTKRQAALAKTLGKMRRKKHAFGGEIKQKWEDWTASGEGGLDVGGITSLVNVGQQLSNQVAGYVEDDFDDYVKDVKKDRGTIDLKRAGAAGFATGGIKNAMFGPFSLISAFREKKKYKQEAEDMNKQLLSYYRINPLGTGASENPYMPTFKCGGRLRKKVMDQGGYMVPAEVEGEEVLKTPGGIVEKVYGPKHEEGGVDVVRPEGTMVFSERLRASTGKSYAEEADDIRKKINKLENYLA